ncbi:cytochrome b561 [Ancylostoma ceylanicum]|uniref:Cytochrome b561 n=1 Tax=Ancylostoma ceylanicum TaxID=53326 RepID=A0A0D6LHB5_9BILA|nr:cytochrome b561 [Ancylostoma ceylanicum]
MGYGIRWPSPGNYGGVNFHGMFMSTAMVFFQGEALLSYRFYRYDAKVLSKFVHVVFHLMAIAFFSTALSAIIIHKNKSFAFGFVNFLFSGITESTRKTFMPMHRIVGCLLFAASLVQAVIGFVQYNGFYGNCPQDHDAPLVCGHYKFVLNFTTILAVLYGFTVLLLVIPPAWQRKKTPEEMQ